MSVDDLIKISVHYEINKKRIKQLKTAKFCYQYINQFIDYEIKGKAELYPKNELFYDCFDYQHTIKFINASYADKEKLINWVKMFTCNKVKLINLDNELNIIYK